MHGNHSDLGVDGSAGPKLARGKIAWNHIQTRDKKNRGDWLLVGDALLEIRRLVLLELKLNKPIGGPYARRFSAMCAEHGFGDVPTRVRADAMWLADNAGEVLPIVGASLAHPTTVRDAYLERLKANPKLAVVTGDRTLRALSEDQPDTSLGIEQHDDTWERDRRRFSSRSMTR